jgi:hypothetical protein
MEMWMRVDAFSKIPYFLGQLNSRYFLNYAGFEHLNIDK